MARTKKSEINYSEMIPFELNLNDEQKEFEKSIYDKEHTVIICNSVAGSGKTQVAVAAAKKLYYESFYLPEDKKRFDGVEYIFSASQERTLGYTTGDVEDKERKYLLPLYDALEKINEDPVRCIGNNILNKKNGTCWINAYSHTFMRGCNLENKVVIVDECQNFTIPDLKKVISRCYDNCKVILLGCAEQIDIDPKLSGFEKCISYFKNCEKVKFCRLTHSYRGWLAEYIDGLE